MKECRKQKKQWLHKLNKDCAEWKELQWRSLDSDLSTRLVYESLRLVDVSRHCWYCFPVTELLPCCDVKYSMSGVTARLKASESMRGLIHHCDLQCVCRKKKAHDSVINEKNTWNMRKSIAKESLDASFKSKWHTVNNTCRGIKNTTCPRNYILQP